MPIDEQLQRQFETAVDQHADSMYRVAYRLTGHRDLASELVQETYLQAWQGLASLRDETKLRSWMFGILRFQFSKQMRRESRTSSLSPESASAIPETGNRETSDVQDQVQAAINQLGDDFRLPILLVSMEGIPVDEAAEILGVLRGTVLSRLHRGREKLKAMLERTGEYK